MGEVEGAEYDLCLYFFLQVDFLNVFFDVGSVSDFVPYKNRQKSFLSNFMSSGVTSPLDIKVFLKPEEEYIEFKLPYTIRYDTRIIEVMEKIFASNALDPEYIKYHPDFQRPFVKINYNLHSNSPTKKVEIKEIDFDLIKSDYNKTTGNYTVMPIDLQRVIGEVTQTGFFNNNALYVESVLEYLTDNYTETDLANIFIQVKSGEIEEDTQDEIETISSNFPNMSKDKLLYALVQLEIAEPGQVPGYETFVSRAQRDYEKFKEVYRQEEEDLFRIPKNQLKDKIVNELTSRDSHGLYASGIINALVEFKGPIDPETETQTDFIDLYKLFDHIELSEFTPSISIANKQPKWLLTETVNLDNEPMKHPKGLTIRMLNSKKGYDLVNLFRNGNIRLRMSWTASDNADYDDMMKSIENLNTFIKGINNKRIAFKGEAKIPMPTLENADIRGFDSALLIKTDVSKNAIYKTIEQNSGFLNRYLTLEKQKKTKPILCDELGIKPRDCSDYSKDELFDIATSKGISHYTSSATRDQINTVYNKVSKRIQQAFENRESFSEVAKAAKEASKSKYKEREQTGWGTGYQSQVYVTSGINESSFEEIDTRVLFIIKSSTVFKDHLLFLVKNVKSLALTNVIFDLGISILKLTAEADTNTELKSIESVKKVRKLNKLKQFKELGIPTNSINCQKPRQPDLGNNYQSGSYSIVVNGHKIVCHNPKYPYPGFQANGVPCCFKSDQRDTKSYKENVKPELFQQEASDAKLNISNVLTTGKILPPGRMGVLTGNIEKLFNVLKQPGQFRRVGVAQVEYPFLSVMYEVTKGIMNFSDFKEFHKELENFLSFGTYKNPREGNVTGISNPSGARHDIKYSGKVISIFESLGNGIVARSLDKTEYIKNVLKNKKSDHTLLVDLLTKFIRMNIFILDEKEENIVCYSKYHKNLDSYAIDNGPSVILYRNGEKYEPIYLVRGSKVYKAFAEDSEVSKMIKELYSFSCDHTPSKQSFFDKALTAKQTYKHLLSSGYIPKAQLVSAFNETIYIVINQSVLVPVKPSGPIAELEITKKITRGTVKDLKFYTVDEIIPIYKDLSERLGVNLNVTAQVLNAGNVESVVLANGFIVPVKTSPRRPDLEVSKINFAIDIDNIIRSGLKATDERVLLAEKVNSYKGVKTQTRYELSVLLNKENNTQLKKSIETIVNSDTDHETKSKQIQELIEPVISGFSVKLKNINSTLDRVLKQDFSPKGTCTTDLQKNCSLNPFCAVSNFKCKVAIPKKYFPDLVESISREIARDYYKKEILSGKVEIHDDLGEFIKRPGEIILYNPGEIVKVLKSSNS